MDARLDSLTRASIDECRAIVSAVFDSVFERLEKWRTAVGEHVGAQDGRVTRAGIDALVEDLLLREFASEHDAVIGAGFVAAPGLIADAEWHLAWWLGDLNTFGMGADAPRVRRLDAVEDPADPSFRDYTTLEWWRVPMRTGERHITGPYVDYLCTDDYTLTLTLPVSRAGRMIGVVGADLYVADLERELLPRLSTVGAPVTLVNASGRVLVSTDAHLPTGSLLRLEGLAAALRPGGSALTQRPGGSMLTQRPGAPVPAQGPAGHEVLWCGSTGLALVVQPRLPQ